MRRGRWSEPGCIYRVVCVTQARRPWFAEFSAARACVDVLRTADARGDSATLAWVVMPDHLHWLFGLPGSRPLEVVVREVKAATSRRVRRVLRAGDFGWQRGFFDRAMRRDDHLVAVSRYIVANPLRAGLVTEIGDYPHWDAAWLP